MSWLRWLWQLRPWRLYADRTHALELADELYELATHQPEVARYAETSEQIEHHEWARHLASLHTELTTLQRRCHGTVNCPEQELPL